MGKYIVYDLEMCKVPKGEKREEFGARQELIQIGAVIVSQLRCLFGLSDKT